MARRPLGEEVPGWSFGGTLEFCLTEQRLRVGVCASMGFLGGQLSSDRDDGKLRIDIIRLCSNTGEKKKKFCVPVYCVLIP